MFPSQEVSEYGYWLEGMVDEETVQDNIIEEVEAEDDSNEYDMTVFDRICTDDEQLEQLVDTLQQEVVDDEENDNNDMNLSDDTLTEDDGALEEGITMLEQEGKQLRNQHDAGERIAHQLDEYPQHVQRKRMADTL